MVGPKHQARAKARTVERGDRKVARKAGKARATLPVRVLGQISELADQPPLIALSAATIAAGLVTRRGRLVRTGVRMLASHGLATKVKSVIKGNVDRTRPSVVLGGKSYHARKGHSHAKGENSFPSGHTAGAVAVARAVARDYPASAPIGYALAAGAAAAQLPRATHYLSDVLVGAAVGWLADAVVALFLPSPHRAPRTAKLEPRSARYLQGPKKAHVKNRMSAQR